LKILQRLTIIFEVGQVGFGIGKRIVPLGYYGGMGSEGLLFQFSD